uniref:Lysosomal Pro-X carboxypeptidase n=1 Tax=Brassica campestris TaxID=3711 RepID=M4E6L4_BRACM
MGSELRLVLIISFVSVLVFSTSSSPLPRFPRQNRARIQLFGEDRNDYQYETKYFSQQLDHFSFADLPKFSQRYLINSAHWTGASELGPIFLYCGNEGDIEWFATNSGFIWEIAPKFGALLVFPEHRYYGESMPYGSREEAYKNATTLSYLTTEQALADFAVFVTDLKRNLSAEASPVVLFGGSYGGMLAAWMRLKYPHIAIGALASSAPILQFEDIVPPQTFYDIVSNDFKRESSSCFNTIKNSWDAIIAEGQKANGLQQLSKTFHFCRALNSTNDLSDWLDSAYSYLAMVDYPYPADFMMPLPGHPIKEVCRKIDGASSDASILERIYAGVSVYYNYTGKVGCFELDDDPHGLDGWNWQACTEMVMPMSSSQKNSMFTAYDFNYSSYKEDCWNTFRVNPRPRWVTTELGGHDIETTLKSFGSNIIFSNGLLDPWSGGSVLKNLSSTIVALVTKEGGHHLDLRPSTPEDPKWLVEQREAEIGLIQGWIRTYRLEKEAQFPLLKRSWESSLLEKEQELLVVEEKIASKESKVLANREVILRKRKSDVEGELESKCKLAENEIESKRRVWELREVDIKQREDLVGEKEHDLEVQSRKLAEKEKNLTERSYRLDEKEKHLNATEEDINRKTNLLENEKERLRKLDLDLQQTLVSLEDKRKRVDSATEKLEALKNETSELFILEMKLKEELDDMRGQKLELLAEADRIKVEKAKFEAEWKHIDVKREELRKEVEYITRQREAFSTVISSPQNVPEDKHELPSNQTQAPPSVMVVLSEMVKITKVTYETEFINKVSNIECSDDPSEAGTKMVEEKKQDSDCNETGIKEKDSDDGGIVT